MSFKDEVNQRKAFADKNGTLINQVKDEILKGAARGLSSVFIPLQSKNGEDTQKIIQFLKEEGFKYYLKYEEHQETKEIILTLIWGIIMRQLLEMVEVVLLKV